MHGEHPGRAPATDFRQDYQIALRLGLAAFFFYMLTTSYRHPYGDEQCYAEVAENILLHGTPKLSNAHAVAGDADSAFIPSYFAIGQSLLLLPFKAVELALRDKVGCLPESFLRMILYLLPAAQCAGIVAILYLLVRSSGEGASSPSRRVALTVAAITAIGTQLWPAASTLSADTSCAFFLTVAILCLVRFRVGQGRALWFVMAALSTACCLITKNSCAVAVPALAVYGLLELNRRRRSGTALREWLPALCAAGAVLAAALLIQMWYNWARYGSVWLSGYHLVEAGRGYGFNTPLLVGLHGILLSSGRSFFLYSPVCLLACFGVQRFGRRQKVELWLIAGVVLPLLVLYAKWWSWHGGWEWGARFFIFAIPLLMWVSVPALQRLERCRRRAPGGAWRGAGFAGLIAVAVGIQCLGVLIHPGACWLLYSRELHMWEHSLHEKGKWEIRDDMLMPHFVPEFSPMATHAWLIWATACHGRKTEAELAARAPWRGLNAAWAPRHVEPYLGLDIWFFGEWVRPGGERAQAVVMGVGLLSALVYSVVRLAAMLSGQVARRPKGGLQEETSCERQARQKQRGHN